MNRFVSSVLLICSSMTAHSNEACNVAYENIERVDAEKECVLKAKNGNAEAQFGYGLMLISGHGRESDPKKAYQWFLSSAKQGHKLSQTMMGRMLSDTRFGVPLNMPEAYAWWSISNNESSASKLWARLSPKQQKKAKELTNVYTAEYSLGK
ncbi:MAG: sel1 repeat family protein [gamma proteobacterium endosymbiont of Lamellibrachia anaximandri]|nr:sel1 repeat family protein [gamma proteobacterium endosymbiont of Lamellibrachia anaximandri]